MNIELDYPLLIEETRTRKYEASILCNWEELGILREIEQELIRESVWLRIQDELKNK